MNKLKKALSLKMLHFVIGIFLAASVGVFISIGFMVHYQDLKETYAMAEKTTAFLKAECQKFDNYIRGNSARSLQDLLDNADGLNRFVSPESLLDPEFLQEFIWGEHVSGVIILDRELQPLAQADMDGKDAYGLWSDVIHQSCVENILQYPKKTYIDHVTVDEAPYDIAAAASADGARLIFCYSSTLKPASDPYELTLKSILENNNFYKDPTLVITDGTKVLSTNNEIVETIGTAQYQELAAAIDWKDDQFTRFQYDGDTYYGLRRVYNKYIVYVVYDREEVFTNEDNVLVMAFLLYMAAGILILAIQRHSDKLSINKMEKQLGIINAISTSYSSTFLLHMEKLELEPIRPSKRLKAVFDKHPGAYDFLLTICKNEIDEEDYSAVMHFLDFDTIADRLKNKGFLGSEVKDRQGTWYSISLIPQKYDENGAIQSILIATRDVTSAKQAEELSFKDKLTGLHNRNYMESRGKQFVRTGDFPVSLIMADCNYLKRTNDTLGHEYGDLLLQKIANSITEAIPANCVAMRVGGDEFLILCTRCSNEMAYGIISDIKRKLAERSDDRLTLSAAFGVFTMEDASVTFEEAYEAADRDMYRDKKASRVER